MRALLIALALSGCASPVAQPPPKPAPAAPSPPPAEPPAFAITISGAGRPVVFIPDLQAPGEVWASTVAHLAGRVEAHVVDVAGFAGTPPTTGPLMPKLREGLARHLRERRAEKAIIVGQQFGATVAYWLAMTEPDLIAGVVAIDAPPSSGESDPEQDAQVLKKRHQLESADSEKFADMTRHRIVSMMADRQRGELLAQRAARSSPKAVADAFHDMMTRDLRSQITNIRAPVLTFLTTENTPPEARAEVEQYYREQLRPIARHELVIVPGSRHYVMFDKPDTFFAHLDRFLTEAK